MIEETGLRVYKELTCLKREQVDIANKVVFVTEFEDPHRSLPEMPLTDIAFQAFQDQIQLQVLDLGFFQVREELDSTRQF